MAVIMGIKNVDDLKYQIFKEPPAQFHFIHRIILKANPSV